MTCASGSAVEHLLAKEGVAGSIPVSRSQKTIERYRKVPLDLFFESNPGLEGSMSPLRSGRYKTKVPRTLCTVSRFFCAKVFPGIGSGSPILRGFRCCCVSEKL